MKKIVSMSLGLSIACLSMFATLSAEPSSNNIHVINIQDATQDILDGIMKGGCSNMIVAFPPNTFFPIRLSLSGDVLYFIESTENPGYCEVKQMFYAKCTEENNPMFSSDLKNWKSFSEFVTGNLSVVFSITDNHPSLMIGGEINKRI